MFEANIFEQRKDNGDRKAALVCFPLCEGSKRGRCLRNCFFAVAGLLQGVQATGLVFSAGVAVEDLSVGSL